MDIQKMHLAVQQGVDKINSFQADTLLPQEIDLELNKAIGKFVNLKYGKNNLYNKGFEESQKRIDDLRSIVKEVSGIQPTYEGGYTNRINLYTFELPENYRFALAINLQVLTKSDCTPLEYDEIQGSFNSQVTNGSLIRTFATAKFTQLDDLGTLLMDPFNTTTKAKPLYTISGNLIEVYTNDIFIIEDAKIKYLKNPAVVSLSSGNSCELADHTHQEIVDMAISSILEGIGDPRYRTHQIELGKNE